MNHLAIGAIAAIVLIAGIALAALRPWQRGQSFPSAWDPRVAPIQHLERNYKA